MPRGKADYRPTIQWGRTYVRRNEVQVAPAPVIKAKRYYARSVPPKREVA